MSDTEHIENLENYNFYFILVSFVLGMIGYYRGSTFGVGLEEVIIFGIFTGSILVSVFNRIYIKTVILGRDILE